VAKSVVTMMPYNDERNQAETQAQLAGIVVDSIR
jgi:hypothetical protein